MDNIFVIGGGYSPEWEVSLGSAQFVYDELKNHYNCYLVTISRDSWHANINDNTYPIDRNDFSFNLNGEKITPTIVVNLIHGTPGEDGLLQGYFDTLNIRHTSCSTLSSAITFDKIVCKRLLAEYGIPMAKDITISNNDTPSYEEILSELSLPLFVKPSNSGSSFGVSKVKEMCELPAAIEAAKSDGGVVIIEQAVEGREMGCGVYATESGIHFLPVTEIVSKREFFDYEAKYQGASEELTPADIHPKVLTKLKEYTTTIYKAMRCRGFVRVDFIIKDDIPHFIELNSIPGMSKESIIPKQLKVAGIAVVDMFREIFKTI